MTLVGYEVWTERRRWMYERYSYYWIAKGRLPLAAAQKLASTGWGKKIRAGGHADGGLHDYVIDWFDEDGMKLIPLIQENGTNITEFFERTATPQPEDWRIVDGPLENFGEAFITLYHIDGDEALRYFKDFLKKGV